MQIRVFCCRIISAPKPSRKVCPSSRITLDILNATFQWLDLPESETLVSQSTKKPEYQYQVPENQKHQSKNLLVKFEGVKVGFS
jgi:hypothetical protein